MEKEDDFYEFLPKSELTEEEFAEAKRIYGETKTYPQVVKYINSTHPELGLKLSKAYFDFYISEDVSNLV